MPVFDFSGSDNKNKNIVTYETFQSSERTATAEKPIMLLENSARKWAHHSSGKFTNPIKRTAFEFDEVDGVQSADIMKIDARFVSLLKWLGENHINVRLSGENRPEGYAVYKIRETEFGGGAKLSANDGFLQGWHERNGGNLSYRLKPEEVELIRPRLNESREWTEIGTEVPGLAGEFFLVTGSGKYFRNIIVDPEVCLAIIEIDSTGTKYRIRWGLVEGGRPTSELPTHLMNHEVKKRITNGKHRVIYHAHTTNTIALTFVLPLDDQVFTRELWESATECPVVFPDGVGVVGWMVPGGREIAVKTAELMKKYDLAIWAHHGTFAAGEDFDLTFGLMHTAEKSAEILVKMLSMQPDKRQTITPDDFRHLAKDFGVTLPEEFLYEK